MARTRVRLNSRGIAEMLKGEVGKSAIKDPTEAVASRARSDAPFASGDYQRSIEVVWDETDRAVGRVVADVKYAALVEANTGNLARSLDAAR